MPSDGLPIANKEQTKRLYQKLKSAKCPKPEEDAKEIMKECKANYARTINHMVFMNVVDRVGRPILPRDFIMPEPDAEKPIPYLAQIVMPRGN